jgi:predicted methyltransferase
MEGVRMGVLTVSTLEKRLRYLLDCSRVRFRKLKGCTGRMDVDLGQVTISLAPGFDDDTTLRILIHELCHLAMPGELYALGVFEEMVIARVLEPQLIDYIAAESKRQAWWLTRLKKLRGGAE